MWDVYNATHVGRAGGASDTTNIKYSLPSLGNKTPDQIRTAHIDSLRRELESKGKSPQTVKHVLGLVRRILRYSARRGLCDMPNMSKLHFDMPKIDNVKTECLTPEQAKALLLALDEDADQNLASLVRLALTTGMRRGALFGLQWQDIDFQKGHITLRGTEAKSGKTTTIPMTAAARAVLESIEPLDSDYVFPSPVNGGKRTECRAFLKRIREKANLPPDFRPLHGLRHTYASWLASSGKVDLFTLQRLLTHGSPQMTQRYAHLADEAIKRAANVIDDCMDIAVNATPPIYEAKPEEQAAKVLHFEQGKKNT